MFYRLLPKVLAWYTRTDKGAVFVDNVILPPSCVWKKTRMLFYCIYTYKLGHGGQKISCSIFPWRIHCFILSSSLWIRLSLLERTMLKLLSIHFFIQFISKSFIGMSLFLMPFTKCINDNISVVNSWSHSRTLWDYVIRYHQWHWMKVEAFCEILLRRPCRLLV